MSDEPETPDTRAEPLTPLQQRQEECGGLMKALEQHCVTANIGMLHTPFLLLAMTDVLVECGLTTRDAIDMRLWDKIHEELARKLEAVEADELAHPKPSPFLVRASDADIRALGRNGNGGRRLH